MMRRVWTLVVTVVVVASVGGTAAAVDAKTGPWSVAAAPAGSSKFAWAKPVQPGFEIFSGLVVEHGVLYGQWGNCTGPENQPVGVAALDASTGRLLWKTPALGIGETANSRTRYTTANGVYVFAGVQRDANGHASSVLVGIDAKSGATRWQADAGPLGPFDWYLDGPVLVGAGLVNGTNSVRGVLRTTGKTVWTVPVDAGSSVDAVGVDDDRVVLELFGTNTPATSVRALDARTGKQLWADDGTSAQHLVAAASGVVVVQTGDTIAGMDGATGKELWHRAGGVAASPQEGAVIGGGRIFVASRDPRSPGEMIDVTTGNTVWRGPEGSYPAYVDANGVLMNERDTTRTSGPPQLDLMSSADGKRLGRVARLPIESDQVMVPPALGPGARVYWGRGCPGRG
jgi:outer membrane protein assembly factor BamB